MRVARIQKRERIWLLASGSRQRPEGTVQRLGEVALIENNRRTQSKRR